MDCTRFLKRVLAVNASFSAASAGLALVAAEALSGWLALPVPAVIATAVGLAAFAAAVLWHASRRQLNLTSIRVIFALDVAWVIGTAAVLAWPGLPISVEGRWLLAAAGVVVGLFAAGEAFGLRGLGALRGSPAPSAAAPLR